MRILFSMRHLGSVRMYESVLRRLAANGHEVHVVANKRDEAALGRALETLLPDSPNVHWRWADDMAPHRWLELATAVRIWLDYLRYFSTTYATAPRLRQRAAERVPVTLRRITEWPIVRTAAGRRMVSAALRVVERALPRDESLDALMREVQPDVVLLTPLLHLGSPQIEVLRSARGYGAKTGLCVGSWDHLSSKSLIRDVPDRVFVWNETQKHEAVTLHGVPADRVAVTGAQCYDQWFDRVPTRSREEFCRIVGLPSDRPLLLWVCSALFVGSPSEARFVRRWIEEVRQSDDPLLRDAAILVRPHPARVDEWREVDLSDLPNVRLYGSVPVDEDAKEDYFESLYFSTAVVGLNTSAFLEAGIVGRPVHTIVLPEFWDNQEGTIHFHYLLNAGGGLLQLARDFDTHRAQLAASLHEPSRDDRNAGFVRAFIRPYGLDADATSTFVDAVETLGRDVAPAPVAMPAWAPALRIALAPVAALMRSTVARTVHPTDRTSAELQRARRKHEHRASREAEEQRLKAEREAERHEKARAAAAARTAEAAARQAAVAASEREKQQRKAEREREKRQHERAKRRAAFRAQIRRRLGLMAKAPR